MNTFEIKIIAITAMIIDHIGLFFFPHLIIFRAIGRLAFPLFAWLIANGARHTQNINKYLFRLFFFACIAQLPFYYANEQIAGNQMSLNVLFTLFLGLSAIKVITLTSNKILHITSIVICLVIANLLHTDYGAAGVLSIVAFYVWYKKPTVMIVSQCLILGILPWISFLLESFYHIPLTTYYIDNALEPLALFALFFILKYTGEQGLQAKYLFYYIYPLQYVIILLIKVL